jgi:hypothetical protein
MLGEAEAGGSTWRRASARPQSIVTLAVLYVMDRWFSKRHRRLRAETRKCSGRARRRMNRWPDAVRQIAEKDDKEAEITQREIRYVGTDRQRQADGAVRRR